ncbi:hypothetical protein [Streptacidiphilus sp. MAP5-3]|uniref:hypothetical protein n=1 Tax=unclassified Streptacidiphilus TaxID=2643834 RepID=UPI0035117E94
MSAVAAGPLLVPGLIVVPDPNSHSPFPWWVFVGVPLFVLGLLLAGGGVLYAVKIRGKARKPADRVPGVLLLLIGAVLAALGFWLA